MPPVVLSTLLFLVALLLCGAGCFTFERSKGLSGGLTALGLVLAFMAGTLEP